MYVYVCVCVCVCVCVYTYIYIKHMGFPGGSMVKHPPTSVGETRYMGSLGWGRYPGGGNGNPLQYSCCENPMNREDWWATVHAPAKSQTRLSD